MAIQIDLAGCTAWVTGGASGIGRAIAATLSHAGGRVIALDRAYPARSVNVCLQAALAAADDGGAGAVAHVHMDVGDPAAVRRIAEELLAADVVPDILVNNAGIARDAPVWKLSDADWAEVVAVDLSGPFHLSRTVVPAMRERRAGAIVNIASINGMRGKFGQVNYAAAKGGLIALTRALARELGPRGIRVNAVAPGMIETPMTGTLPPEVREKAARETALGCIGAPQHVADAVLFLASPLAAHVTGHVLVVDGGQIA